MAEQARREIILGAADRLFRHYGPQKTTMADVAREASVGVGSVYLEFPSKDALVEALSRQRYRGVLDAMRAAADEPGARAADSLVRLFDARAKGFLATLEAGAHACDLLHCGSEAVKSAQTDYHEEERAILCGVLQAGVERGELAVPEMDSTVRVLLLAYAAFVPPWISRMDAGRLAADMAAMHALVLNGLLIRAGAGRQPR